MAAKTKTIDTLVAEHLEELQAGGQRGISWLPGIPDWLLAYSFAIAINAIKNLAHSDVAKALMKKVVLQLWKAIAGAYSGDADFTCP